MSPPNPTRSAVDFDAELQRHDIVLRQRWGLRPRDRVLDVGCGAGSTTCNAARSARDGSAVGIDVSGPMLERARTRAADEGLLNASFVQADASCHPFPPEAFDVVISRFGTMFFAQPVGAFRHLGASLRHGGRLSMMVWQLAELNEWAMSIARALRSDDAATATPAPGAPDPFSLGDPDKTRHILDAAGWTDIAFFDVNEPVYYGATVSEALDWVRGFSASRQSLQRMAPADRVRGLDALREMLAAHQSEQGVWFDSRAWLVAAQRP